MSCPPSPLTGWWSRRRRFASSRSKDASRPRRSSSGVRSISRETSCAALFAGKLATQANGRRGSAGGYFTRLLGGGKTKVIELHSERNPYFGGVNPEPIPENLVAARNVMLTGEYDLVALLRLPRYDDLADVVTGRMMQLSSITRTHTLMAFQRYSRADLQQAWDIGVE